jgi:hypothetical protein
MTSTWSPARAAGLLAVLAVASALLSNFAPLDPWEVLQIGPPRDSIALLPGVYFGLVLGLGVFLIETKSPLRIAVVLVVVVVAWVCAWKTGYEVYGRLEQDFPGPIGFGGASARAPLLLAIAGVVAGIVGSAITVVGIAIVSRDVRSVAVCARTIGIGAAAGAVLAFNSGVESMLPLFLVWQPAVAASIALGLARPAAPVVAGSARMEA